MCHRARELTAVALLVGAIAAAGASQPAANAEEGAARAGLVGAVPGHALPIEKLHRYRMAGRIRPLLFWMGRDRVGLAQVTWRGTDAGARGYELLVGTDPAVAPRRINRWGYITEESGAAAGAVLALMSNADEDSYEEAKASATADDSGAEFRAIQTAVRRGVATSQTARVHTDTSPTIHDVQHLLERVRIETAQASQRQRAVATDVRPGFLCAVADLVGRTLVPGAAARQLQATSVRYVFGQRLFDLRVKSLRQEDRSKAASARPRTLRTGFEITNLATGRRTEFEMVYGSEGELAGVPLFVSWQPRWWLRVELHLEETGRPAA